MAHFAKIQDNKVVEVIVVHNNDAPTEVDGQAFIASIGLGGVWVQTSYNNNFRGKFAGVGDVWNGTDFVAPPSPEVESEV